VIPRRVLEDARGLVRASRPNESGGILVGRLYRDVETRDLFADVTAAIPAQHTTSAVDRLTFTPETWAAAATELDRRGRGEIYLGWFHSHPGPEQCASCPDEKKALCALGHGFLSADDRLFHRVVFPRAYSFALVFSPTTGDEIEHALFGWRRGVLEKREAHVTGNGRERSIPLDAKVPDETPRGGNEHVTECPSEDTRRKHDPRASS
jgi:proteasome lid subunit RPN8/RPN11